MKQNLPCALELRNQMQFILEGELSCELMEVNRNLKQREIIYHLSLVFKKKVYDWDYGFVVVIVSFYFVLLLAIITYKMFCRPNPDHLYLSSSPSCHVSSINGKKIFRNILETKLINVNILVLEGSQFLLF